MSHVQRGFDPFDRRTGSGSRSVEEDWLDEHSTSAENEWSTAATTFYYWEAPPHLQDRFESLYDKQHGWGEKDRRGSIRRSHIVKDAETFSNILELPDHQRKRVVSIAEDLDFSSNRFGGKSYEKVLLAICSLVSDEALSRRLDHDDADEGGRESTDKRVVLSDEFKTLMDANGLGSREHNRIRQMVREKTEYF